MKLTVEQSTQRLEEIENFHEQMTIKDAERQIKLLDENKRLKEENEVYARLIKRLEWCVYDGPNFDVYSCPICGLTQEQGHGVECELSSAIDRIQNKEAQS